MWKSREGMSPPPTFWADFVATVNHLFPGAALDKSTLDELYDLVVDEWRNGTAVHLIARQLCSCDGHTVHPSEGARRRLGRMRGIARPPEGAVPGQVFGLDELRDASPLARLLAQQALVDARIRSESGKRGTEKRSEKLERLKSQRAEIALQLTERRQNSLWSKQAHSAEPVMQAPEEEPTPAPVAAPSRVAKQKRRKPKDAQSRSGDEARTPDAIPPRIDPLDDDIAEDLINEIARRS